MKAAKQLSHAKRDFVCDFVWFRRRHQPDLKTFDMEVLESATPGESS